MKVLGIDPGPSDFAWAVYDSDVDDITLWGVSPYLMDAITDISVEFIDSDEIDLTICRVIGIERVRSYGQIIGNSILETAEVVGALEQESHSFGGCIAHLIPRRTIVAHLTGSAVGGDKQVNARVNQICPNFAKVRKGLNGHHRAAAAVAITCYDKFGKGVGGA